MKLVVSFETSSLANTRAAPPETSAAGWITNTATRSRPAAVTLDADCSVPLPGEYQPDRAHSECDHRGQQRVLGAHRGPRR
jgi:hypothetical protein